MPRPRLTRLVAVVALIVSGALVADAAAPVITATLADSHPDTDSLGRVRQGETIAYKAIVTNSGTTAATGVQYQHILDTNTAYVASSFRTTPVAAPDAYESLGNVGLEVPAPGVLANDVDPDGDSLVAVAASGATSAGGTFSLAGDGSFSYTPPAGYEGADTFTYVIRDGTSFPEGGQREGTGTVTITVDNVIWFIDNSAGAGDGRLATPFNSLAAFSAVNDGVGTGSNPAPGEAVYLATGSGDYPGELKLRNDQRLIGQGASASLASIAGLTVPAHSVALPATGGTRPVIENPAGSGVFLYTGSSSVTTVRGIEVGDTIDDIYGINFGSVTFGADVVLSGTGYPINVGNGAVNGTIGSASCTDGRPFYLLNCTGSLVIEGGTLNLGATGFVVTGGTISLTYRGNINQTTSNPAISITNHSSGTVSFNTGTINVSNGTGLQFNNADGIYNFTGPTILNGGDAGIDITNGSAGTFSFGSGTSITNPSGNAFSVDGGNGNITYAGSLSDNGGRVVGITGRTGGTVTFSGSIENIGGSATGIYLNGNSGGATVFSSDVTLATGAFNAVVCTSNPGHALTFSGGQLNLTTGAGGWGFYCQDSGSVTVTGSNNRVVTNNLSAVDIQNTTIGGGGVTFKMVDCSGSGTAPGIVLKNTGAGPFTVTGTGTPGSGGTLANKTSATQGDIASGVGLALDNVQNVTLNHLQINDCQNWGIRGFDVHNLTMNGVVVNGTNGTDAATDEGAVSFGSEPVRLNRNGLTGAVNITNCTFAGGCEDNFRLVNKSGVLDRLTMTNTTIGLNSNDLGNDGILVEATDSATVKLTIDDCTFTGSRGDIMQLNMLGAAQGDLIFTDNTSHNSHANIVSGGGGLTVSGGGTGSTFTLTYEIARNSFRKALGTALNVSKGSGAGSMIGKVVGNTVGQSGVTDSGSAQGSGISIGHTGAGVSQCTVKDNYVYQYNNYGIYASAGDASAGGGNGTFDLAVKNNTIAEPGAFAMQGIHGNFGMVTGDAHVVCLDVQNNTIGGNNTAYTAGVRVRHRQSTSVKLPGYAGTQYDTAAVAAYLDGRNSITVVDPAVAALAATSGTGPGFGAGTCITPVAARPAPRPYRYAVQPGESRLVVLPNPLDAVPSRFSPRPAPGGVVAWQGAAQVGLVLLEGLWLQEVQPAAGRLLAAAERLLDAAAYAAGPRARRSHRLRAVAVTGNGTSGQPLTQVLGNLDPGQAVRMDYQVTVDDPVTAGAVEINTGGTVSGGNFVTLVTDDPTLAGTNNTTVSRLAIPAGITPPANLNVGVDTGLCTAAKSFAATVTGVPAPTVAYKIDATPIGSPYAFPLGVSTVDITATNGVGTPATGSFTVTVTESVPPVLGGGGGTADYTEDQLPVAVLPAGTITDCEANGFASGTLVVDFNSTNHADDRLTIINEGVSTGQIGLSGDTVSYGGTAFATANLGSGGGAGATPLTITFQSGANLTSIQALLRKVAFHNVSAAPTTAPRTVRFTITQPGDGAGTAISRSVAVTAVNDSPTLTTNAGLTLAEGATAVVGNSVLQVGDPDQLADQVTYTLAVAPSNGTLRKNASPLSTGGTFTQDDLTANRITYTHSGNETTTDSFSFTVSDGAGGSIGNTAFAITVTAVNDSPQVATNNGLTVAEGATGTIGASALRTTDSDHTAGQVTYSLTTAPTGGTLKLSGSGLSVGGTFTQDDLDNSRVTYVHGADELPADSFGFTVGDGTAVVSGQTFAITVTPVNDPPALTNLGLTLAEGGTGVVTTSSLAVSDVDNTATELVFTLSAVPTHGTLQKSASPLSVSGTFTQDDLATGKISYVHDGSETTADSFNFAVSDGDGGSIGSTSFAITVTAVNDAPQVTNNGLTVTEASSGTTIGTSALSAADPDSAATAVTFTVTVAPTAGTLKRAGSALATGGAFTQDDLVNDRLTYSHGGGELPADSFTFSVSDGDGGTVAAASFDITVTAVNDQPVVAANSGLTLDEGAAAAIVTSALQTTDAESSATQIAYTLTTAPTAGALALSGSTLSSGATFTQDDLDHGRVTYTHDSSETTTDSFGFSVGDGAGGSITGQTFAITITAVNDSPQVATNDGLTVAEGGTATIGASALQTTDADHGAAQVSYTLTTAPTGGTLKLSGSGLSVGGTFTQDDLDNSRVTYAHGAGELPADSFGFTVGDGTAVVSGQTFAITVTPVNDPPTLTNLGLTVGEGATLTVSTAHLAATDVDNTATELVFTLSAVPTHGTLQKSASPLSVSGTFTQDDLANGRITYTHDSTETSADSFGFSLSDGAGANISALTFSIAVTGDNDPPTIAVNSGLTLAEAATAEVATSVLRIDDSDHAAAARTLTLTTLPTYGQLRLSGSPLAVGGSFTQQDIDSHQVVYTHGGDEHFTDSFAFTVADALGGAAGPATFAITVTPVNDPPTLTNLGLTLAEGGTGVVTTSSLAVSDVDNTATELVLTLSAVPTHGTLQKSASPLSAAGTFTQDDLANGRITYTHDSTETSADSFGFSLSDGAGANISALTFSIAVTGDNDPPTIAVNSGLTLAEAATAEVATSVLRIDDSDHAAAARTLTLTTLPTYGQLLLSGSPLAVGGSFTQQDIDSHQVVYTHGGDEHFTDSFAFTVADALGAAAGSATFAITVTPVNDPPVLVTNTGEALPQGGTQEIDEDDLAVTDPDNSPSELTYLLTAQPAHGALRRSATVLAVGATFTQADLNGGLISYQHDNTETRTDAFSFTFSDGAGGTLAATTFALATNNVIGPPAKLAFSAQPPNGAARQPLATAVTVLVQDAAGDTVSTASHAITLGLKTNPSGAALGGTLTATAVNGLATFNDLVLDKAGQGFALAATAAGLSEGVSSAFNVTAAVPVALAVLTQLPAQRAGQAFELQVEVRDAAGQRVLDAVDAVTVSLKAAPEGAALAGVKTRPAVAGLATFPGLSLAKSGAYQLGAYGLSLVAAEGNSFQVGPADAAKLFWRTPPADTAAGVAMAPFEVEVRDEYDNKVDGDTRAIALALATNPTGATLIGPNAVDAEDGVARFTDTRLNQVGSGYTLVATADGLPELVSAPFTVGSAQPAQVAWVTQPSSGTAGIILAPLAVEVRDSFGNRVQGDTTRVSLQVGGGSAGASLGGTISRAAVDGLVTFDDLRLDRQGSGYWVEASAEGLAPARSTTFDLAPAPLDAAHSSLTADKTTARGDGGEEVAFSIALRDSFDNPLAGIDQISVTADDPAGLTISEAASTNAAGVTTVRVSSVQARSVTFTALQGATALGSPVAINFVPGPASAARSSATVPAGRAGEPTTIAVEVRDSQGNLRTSGGDAVSVTVSGANEATPTVVDPGTGLYTATYTPLHAGTDTIAVTVAEAALSGSPFASLVSPGAPDASRSSVTLEPAAVAANGSSAAVLSITARDAQDNPIPALPAEAVVVTSDPAEDLLLGPAAATDGDGATQVELRSARPGTVTLTVTLQGVTLAAQPVVTFRPELILQLPAGRHFVGLPFMADDRRPEAVFGGGLGAQVAAWDGSNQRFERYRPPGSGGDLFEVMPGCGLWVQLATPRTVSLLGEPVREEPFACELATGWECLANPYDRDLEWRLEGIRVYQNGSLLGTLADTTLWSKVLPYVWYYDSAARANRLVFPGLGADRVPRQHGFWAAAMEPGISLELAPPAPGRSRVSRRAVSLRDWAVTLQASSAAGGASVSLGASSQVSRAMGIEVPPETDPRPLELVVLSADGRRLAGSMVPPGTSLECELAATSREAGEVTLSWPSLLRDLPRGLVLTLTDQQSGQTVLLNTHASWRYTAGAGEVRRFAFRARLGRLDRAAITQLSWQAARGGGLTVTLGLDAPAEVALTVRGMGGQLVRQVVSQAAGAGLLSIAWDGLDASGRRVPRGTYLLEAVATSPNGAAARASRTVTVR